MKREDALIEADELLTKIDDPNLRLYDTTILFFRKENELTAQEEYEQAHIPGAAFFDHDAFSDPHSKFMYMVLPEEQLAAQIGRIGIDHDSEVVFYTSGVLACATRAWWLLRYAGHNNVRVLNGGLAAWQAAGGALEAGMRQYAPATFESRLRPSMFVGRDDVEAVLADGSACVVNTLTQESYDQGHITGSSLLPITDLAPDMATFLPQDALATRLADEAQNERIITYCGGGIAATTNAMAHLMAGNPNVAVYDGSMDEWGKEGLPVTSKQ